MKRCPRCGAAIKSSAAAFCPKCKKPLNKPVRTNGAIPGKPSQNARTNENKIRNPKQRVKKKPWLLSILMPYKKKPFIPRSVPIKKPADENYDGYYDDRPTDDNAQNKDSFDPELIKRIALIAGGAVVLVILSVVLMNLL